MSVTFQVQVGSDNIASRSFNGDGGCPRSIGKQYLDEIYKEACRERLLDGNQEFSN